ncbi:MAG: tetratricopeptide repeat protein [Ancrocorticia sp.]|uniref:tetratricopeptide repeat protein n=1 Tax=Ancrocorticia sp. TaxID=2593684 RepID=UPI003F8E7E3F
MTQPLDGSMYGAVDLAGLANAASPAQAGSDGSLPGPYIVDVTADSLRTVLETSGRVPVILIFHAEQSEVSGTLATQFEKLADEAQGHFQLGKVDVGAHPEVAQAFGLQGVPAAVAVLQGQPVPLFQGTIDDGELAPLITRVLEAASQMGVTGVLDGEVDAEPPAPQHTPRVAAGMEALDAKDLDLAEAEFTQALKDNPGDEEAKALLAQVELVLRVQAVEDPAALLQESMSAGLQDIDIQLKAADIECYSRRPDSAFARLIDVISATSGDDRETVRTRLLELFEIVGADEPVVSQARKALAMALFS